MDPNPPQDQYQDQKQSEATPKQSVVARVQQANNVLVTVKSNPSVDELSATIGLTLMLNKLGKHATAVYSGETPSTLEFLKPEETLETNTDSLRDFIVSLDKSKADKLRYKVEENVVKIFITPYRTSITEKDLEFTQGDFNVDVVMALGVTQREELDQAITAHGRILHDATVVTVTAGQDHSELGQINWQEPAASSLSEMLVSISEAFQGGLIDEQIATAFLTGIVSETERFSNPKTSPKVMTMAAQLMAAGANQQLIANELEKAVEVDLNVPAASQPESVKPDAVAGSDGSLNITHDDSTSAEAQPAELPEPESEQKPAEPLLPPSERSLDQLLPKQDSAAAPPESFNPLMPDSSEPARNEEAEAKTEPSAEQSPVLPPLPGPAPASTSNSEGDIHIDHEGNLVRKSVEPKHKVLQPLPAQEPAPMPEPVSPAVSKLPPPPEMDLTPSEPIQDNTTLEQIEKAVNSPHVQQAETEAGEVGSARDAVSSALSQAGFDPAGQARTDLNAMPLGMPPAPASYDSYRLDASGVTPPPPVTDVSGSLPTDLHPQSVHDKGITPPPPVPPPMMPPQ